MWIERRPTVVILQNLPFLGLDQTRQGQPLGLHEVFLHPIEVQDTSPNRVVVPRNRSTTFIWSIECIEGERPSGNSVAEHMIELVDRYLRVHRISGRRLPPKVWGSQTCPWSTSTHEMIRISEHILCRIHMSDRGLWEGHWPAGTGQRQTWVTALDSWFPLISWTRSG